MKKLVVLTGAGVSAESGLQTFRDCDGLWEGYDINEVATYDAWLRNPGLVLDFYNMRRQHVKKAQPNEAHKVLATLEKDFDVTVVTQNIDDLHERAGSSKVIHLHGQIFQMKSEQNDELVYPIDTDIRLGDTAEDGGQLRPNIVWFGEAVPMMLPAIDAVKAADIFLVVGTSLVVYPAASLVGFAPYHIPKFIVDKKIPYNTDVVHFESIEKPATSGMAELVEKLKLHM